jgi:Golgi nucleoside diphosphatase
MFVHIQEPPHGHIIVVDAGSSGTRLFVYRWQGITSAGGTPRVESIPPSFAPHKIPRKALSSRRAYQRVETEPGLHSFVEDPMGIEESALGMRAARRPPEWNAAGRLVRGGPEFNGAWPPAAGPLLAWAEAVIPRRQWAATPIFLFGTAGVRKLAQAQQEVLLTQVRTSLLHSHFR